MTKAMFFKSCLAVAVLLGLVTFSCCDNPEPDPCKGQEVMTGSFTIYEHLANSDIDSLLVADTVITGNQIVFEADTTYQSYEWKVGDDPRVFNEKSVSLIFNQPENQIEVTLIAKWRKSACFPDDDGVDTVRKTLTVVSRDLNPIFGTYRGSNESTPSDVFDVEVTYEPSFNRTNIININKNCYPIDESIGLTGLSVATGYKRLMFYAGFYHNSCDNPQGILTVSPSGKEVLINYSTGNGSPTQTETARTNHVFNGNKIE